MFKPDAELHNWSLVLFGDGYRVVGEVHNDTKGRFKDGEIVTTSKIERLSNGELKTENTLYRLINV